MIQDIYPNQFNIYKDDKIKAKNTDYAFGFYKNKLVLKKIDNSFIAPLISDFNIENLEMKFLGKLENKSCFIFEYNEEMIINKNLELKDINFLRYNLEKHIKWALINGYQFYNWYKKNKFCGQCGNLFKEKKSERALECSCGNISYPKISPAIIVAITKGDKILLARNANFTPKLFSVIAGFVDVGETFEETVKREAMEEVGIKLKNIKYYKSQPWPFSSSIMVGFVAECDDEGIITVDGKEIVEADWYSKNELPIIPDENSIAGELIKLFIENKITSIK